MKFAVNRKWLYLAGAGVLLLLMLVLSISPTSDEPELEVLLTALPATPEPDADSPADTIKTLTATVASLIKDVEMLSNENEQLRAENVDLVTKTNLIEHRIVSRMRGELQDQQIVQEQLTNEIQLLTTQIDNFERSLDVGDGSFNASYMVESMHSLDSFDAVQWLKPLEVQIGSELTPQSETELEPRFTLPQNSTLVGSTTMTALIGRVPVENRVTDPMPFKVINGNTNLTANGLTVDGLEGAIWSGYAIGDWALSCVSGTLTSVTFVFDDGRIRTVGENQRSSEALGWISDASGVPCITGERKTNVRAWLLAQLGAGATSAAADAIANANVVVEQSPSGFKEAIVDGDLREFVLGKSITGSADVLATWLAERASLEFDAIFVPNGKDVAIHVDRAIYIDYEPQGRKLTYEKTHTNHATLHTD